jgi:hypothetical protein
MSQICDTCWTRIEPNGHSHSEFIPGELCLFRSSLHRERNELFQSGRIDHGEASFFFKLSMLWFRSMILILQVFEILESLREWFVADRMNAIDHWIIVNLGGNQWREEIFLN